MSHLICVCPTLISTGWGKTDTFDKCTYVCLSSISSPTPDVHWVRTDGRPLPDRAKIQSFGQELMIGNLQFEDAGTYECWATNTNTQSRVQRTVTVRVECETFLLAYDFVTFYASFFCCCCCCFVFFLFVLFLLLLFFLYLCGFLLFQFFLWVGERGGRERWIVWDLF